ncbi:MAG: MBL fold metallo-hydrolase [Clostridiales bacterium]|nr:MBL fold metallo-hydrolase [Clostridiales bacterium]
MRVRQIKIEFHVTKEIKRFVYVYLIETEEGCVLIDSGVAGSETMIEKVILESGRQPAQVKAVFLTHAHPDHIGTANYFREKYGAKIYASEGERAWIEDIDLQFARRPIPNFYNLAGKSTMVDQVVKDGDKIYLSEGIHMDVIGTPGHSADEVSYRIGEVAFIGDAVPVRGVIPIFINLDNTKSSLAILEKLSGMEIFYPAWDQTYSAEMMRDKIQDAKEIINELEKIVCELDRGMELSTLVELVCERLHMPMWKANPLFARTIECCRRK